MALSFLLSVCYQLRSIVAGLAALALGSLMAYGAIDFGERTTAFSWQGVRATAVVSDIRPDPMEEFKSKETTICLLEFEGRTAERELPGKHDIGEEFAITYDPSTMELRPTAECVSPWKLWPVLGVVILFGLVSSAFGGWIIYDAVAKLLTGSAEDSLNNDRPNPHVATTAEATPEQSAP